MGGGGGGGGCMPGLCVIACARHVCYAVGS